MQKRRDDALISAFHLMSVDEQDRFISYAEMRTDGRNPKQPVLRLVSGAGAFDRRPSINGARKVN